MPPKKGKNVIIKDVTLPIPIPNAHPHHKDFDPSPSYRVLPSHQTLFGPTPRQFLSVDAVFLKAPLRLLCSHRHQTMKEQTDPHPSKAAPEQISKYKVLSIDREKRTPDY